MIIDFSFSGGLVFGISHTDEAMIEVKDNHFELCNAILIHLGLFTIAILFT